MKRFSLILMMIATGFGESSFGAPYVDEKKDRLGRVAALRLALPDAELPRGLKRRAPSPEAAEEVPFPELKRARSAPGSGGRKKEKNLQKSPRKLQDVLNLFHELKKQGSPKKEELLDRLDGLPLVAPKAQKGSNRNLSGKLK